MTDDRSFPGLRAVRVVLLLAAVLNLAGGLIVGLLPMAHKKRHRAIHPHVHFGIVFLIGAVLLAVVEWGAAEAIELGLAIDANTNSAGPGARRA